MVPRRAAFRRRLRQVSEFPLVRPLFHCDQFLRLTGNRAAVPDLDVLWPLWECQKERKSVFAPRGGEAFDMSVFVLSPDKPPARSAADRAPLLHWLIFT